MSSRRRFHPWWRGTFLLALRSCRPRRCLLLGTIFGRIPRIQKPAGFQRRQRLRPVHASTPRILKHWINIGVTDQPPSFCLIAANRMCMQAEFIERSAGGRPGTTRIMSVSINRNCKGRWENTKRESSRSLRLFFAPVNGRKLLNLTTPCIFILRRPSSNLLVVSVTVLK
jgi:hypothetical protein